MLSCNQNVITREGQSHGILAARCWSLCRSLSIIFLGKFGIFRYRHISVLHHVAGVSSTFNQIIKKSFNFSGQDKLAY